LPKVHKFFGWGDRSIPINIAHKIGEMIHEALGRNGLLGQKNAREVFPFNHPQVLLPMRVDKITIIDTGVLPTCTRKKRDFHGGMENYETYSVLAFTQCRLSEDPASIFSEFLPGPQVSRGRQWLGHRGV
jgi:hypothetical protein